MERIWHFLADRSVDLADRIEAAIRSEVERLTDFPYSGRPRGDGSRELLVRRVQYRVAYGVEEDRVFIFAVRSTREDS